MKTFAGKGIPDGGCEKVGLTAIGGSMPAPDEVVPLIEEVVAKGGTPT